MAKGLTTAPLVIWVAADWYSHPAILKLMAEGHRVINMARLADPVVMVGSGQPDLILHPAAHAWTDDFWDYLPAAITAARRRRRETK